MSVPTAFFNEILEQPAALRDLIAHYQSTEDRAALERLERPRFVLLSGMGASFHAAQYGALLFGSIGIAATAVEASDLLNFDLAIPGAADLFIFISQSGSSGEIPPLLARLSPHLTVLGITNTPDSPLAQAAQSTLLQHAGPETTVATKTYINSLACLWLMAQRWSGRLDQAYGQLEQVAEAATQRLEARDSITGAWFDAMAGCEQIAFVGHGPHVSTARQGAMMLAEWAKVRALWFSIGAFRHGFIEFVTPTTGFIAFGESGLTRVSTRAVLDEVGGYGARTLSVVGGLADTTASWDDFLAPMLDVIPAQLFAEAMARRLGVEPGFRYIQKVVRAL
ncbi:MAG: SIS domain-containing protein [Chloroflexi bacterium]|nr:SIS domain-containing protein [Chloroflexota bacterium]